MKTGCCNTRMAHRIDKNGICLNARCGNYLGVTSLHYDFLKWKKPASLLLFIIYMLFSFDDFSKANHGNDLNLHELLSTKQVPLNADNLEKELYRQDVLCPQEVLSQIKIESGNFNSFLVKRTNNILGMRYPAKRNTTACGIYLPANDTIIYGSQSELKKYSAQNNYAVYKTWQDAVSDYKIWQEHSFKVSDKYLEFLGKVYAEDQQYAEKIKSNMKKI